MGSSDVPSLPNALNMSSMESVASALRIMQFDRSLLLDLCKERKDFGRGTGPPR